MISLDVNDSNQVASPSRLEIDLGLQGRKAVVFSGIARPEWVVTDDGHIANEQVSVNLRYTALAVDQATLNVGLASIGNGGSDFQHAINDCSICIDSTSQELILTVDAALMGDPSKLNRFSYQVFATLTTQITGISGSIRWRKEIFDASKLSDAAVSQLFLVSANREEIVPPPPDGGFGTINFIPLAFGTTEPLQQDDSDFIVPYNIPGAPYAQPLVVRVDIGPTFHATTGTTAVGQISGPSPLVLTVAAPGVSGVDFRVTTFVIR